MFKDSWQGRMEEVEKTEICNDVFGPLYRKVFPSIFGRDQRKQQCTADNDYKICGVNTSDTLAEIRVKR